MIYMMVHIMGLKQYSQKGYIRIDGKTDARQREELRAKFQGDNSIKVG